MPEGETIVGCDLLFSSWLVNFLSSLVWSYLDIVSGYA